MDVLFHGVDILRAPKVKSQRVVASVELVGSVVARQGGVHRDSLHEETKGQKGKSRDGPEGVRLLHVVVVLKDGRVGVSVPAQLNPSDGSVDAVLEFVRKHVNGKRAVEVYSAWRTCCVCASREGGGEVRNVEPQRFPHAGVHAGPGCPEQAESCRCAFVDAEAVGEWRVNDAEVGERGVGGDDGGLHAACEGCSTRVHPGRDGHRVEGGSQLHVKGVAPGVDSVLARVQRDGSKCHA